MEKSTNSHIIDIQLHPLRLKVNAVVFGEIADISSYWAKCDRIASWLKIVCETFGGQDSMGYDVANTTALSCGRVRGDSEDNIAFLVSKRSRDTIMRSRRDDTEAAEAFRTFLQNRLSAIAMAELSVTVSYNPSPRYLGTNKNNLVQEPYLTLTCATTRFMSSEKEDYLFLLHDRSA